MKLWSPKRVAANSQARRPLTAFALTIPVVVSMLLVSNYSSRSFSQQQALSFNRDVAPIFYKHCAACHQPEDIAPFSVLDYEDVLPWKNSIREKVAAREMPPWHADPRYGEFSNEARLSAKFTVARIGVRSEEHTSELQSLAYLVCRLLLEKKN